MPVDGPCAGDLDVWLSSTGREVVVLEGNGIWDL